MRMRLLAPTLLLLAGCASPLPTPAIENELDFQLRLYAAAARYFHDHHGRWPTLVEELKAPLLEPEVQYARVWPIRVGETGDGQLQVMFLGEQVGGAGRYTASVSVLPAGAAYAASTTIEDGTRGDRPRWSIRSTMADCALGDYERPLEPPPALMEL
jgi:hypothetical protein